MMNGKIALITGATSGMGKHIATALARQGATVIIATKVLWIPAAICIPLIFLSFWLGRRYELAALRRHLESPEE